MGTSHHLPGEPEQQARSSAIGQLLVRQRVLIIGALAGIVVLCWLYLADTAADMGAMDPGMTMPPKGTIDLLLLLAMWWVMMIGMMLPSATPMVLTFASINRNARARHHPYVPTTTFASGYLLAWGGFSIAATLVQWGLEQASLLSPMAMKVTSPMLGGALFVAAGLYQLSPLKQLCLSHCRSPFDFVLNHWRSGAGGALRMGLEHGLYCLGCCWVLMALLFAVGAMNLLWVAGLAVVVLVEKLFPSGIWIARIGGLLLIAWGVILLRAT